MTNERRARIWLVAALLAVASAILAWWWFRPSPEAPDTSRNAVGPVPYTFEWTPGATRGVDVPTHIYIPSIDKRVPIQFIKDLRSEPGEDRLAFLHRVRLDFVAYSARQEVEACAEICAGPDGMSVRMTSINAVRYCAVAPACVAGHTSTAESIHSHCPRRQHIVATLADEYLSGGADRAGDTAARCDTERFSRMDLASPRGMWLAARRRLLYKDVDGEVTAFPGEHGAR